MLFTGFLFTNPGRSKSSLLMGIWFLSLIATTWRMLSVTQWYNPKPPNEEYLPQYKGISGKTVMIGLVRWGTIENGITVFCFSYPPSSPIQEQPNHYQGIWRWGTLPKPHEKNLLSKAASAEVHRSILQWVVKPCHNIHVSKLYIFSMEALTTRK